MKSRSKFRLIRFLLVLIGIVPIDTFGTAKSEPRERFFHRYERATDIVFGSLVSVEDSEKKISQFKVFDGHVKKNVLKIEKSWKGQSDGEISFYSVYTGKIDFNKERRKLQGPPLKPRLKYLVYLRDGIDGVKFAQIGNGFERIVEDSQPEFLALDALRAGKPMVEALQFLGETEIRAYNRQLLEK